MQLTIPTASFPRLFMMSATIRPAGISLSDMKLLDDLKYNLTVETQDFRENENKNLHEGLAQCTIAI